jgi:hypothetical protein
MSSGFQLTLIVVIAGFGGGAGLFVVYVGLRHLVARQKTSVGRREALLVPLCFGGLVCGLLYAISVNEPGPFGEIIFVAIYLTVFFLPSLIAGSVFAARVLRSWIEARDQHLE